MVTINDIANPNQNSEGGLGFGNILKGFIGSNAGSLANTQPSIPAEVKKYEPFKVKVINGDVVTEYVMRDGALPQVNATSLPVGSPASSFVRPPSDEGNGRTLESLTNQLDASGDDENLEF